MIRVWDFCVFVSFHVGNSPGFKYPGYGLYSRHCQIYPTCMYCVRLFIQCTYPKPLSNRVKRWYWHVTRQWVTAALRPQYIAQRVWFKTGIQWPRQTLSGLYQLINITTFVSPCCGNDGLGIDALISIMPLYILTVSHMSSVAWGEKLFRQSNEQIQLFGFNIDNMIISMWFNQCDLFYFIVVNFAVVEKIHWHVCFHNSILCRIQCAFSNIMNFIVSTSYCEMIYDTRINGSIIRDSPS